MHFNKKFSLDVEKKTAGKRACQRLPAFFWPIRDETKGQSEEESGHFFSSVDF